MKKCGWIQIKLENNAVKLKSTLLFHAMRLNSNQSLLFHAMPLNWNQSGIMRLNSNQKGRMRLNPNQRGKKMRLNSNKTLKNIIKIKVNHTAKNVITQLEHTQWLLIKNICMYRASHIILDYLRSLTPKYAHYTQKI